MKKSITRQLGVIIVCVIFASMVITSVSNYWVSYNKTYEAAGLEAVGCANITTGLIEPNDIEEIIAGNEQKRAELQNALDWTTDHKSLFETQYILLLDGTILAADSNLQEQGFKAGDKFYIDKEAVQTIQATNHPQYSVIYEYGGLKRLTGYAPIFKNHDPAQEIIALNAIDFNADIVQERTFEEVRDSFLLGLLPMSIACLLTIFLIRRKTKPITALIDYAKKVAEGDLTAQRLQIKNKDEIGDLAETLHYMASQLRDLIHQVSSSSEQVAASSQQLTASAEQTNHATELIASTMHQMSASMEKQSRSAEETAEMVDEITHSIQQIAANAQRVNAAAMGASEKAAEGGQAIQTAERQMNSIHDTVSGVADVVKGLGQRSNEIGEIVEVITGIANQTNLLALNAAIEAARAGEHGRGFAVVAGEVRKLAEQSSQSAGQISQLITSIQEIVSLAVQSMDHATNEVVTGIEVVNKAGGSFEQIQYSVNSVSGQINEVSTAAQQMAAASEQMVQSMRLMTSVTEAAASGTHEVSAATDEQLASMQEISVSANYLSDMAERLQMIVGKFKI